MNLTDPSTSLRMHLCPEGLEKWAEYIASVLADDNRTRIEADRACKQHIQDCELCGGNNE